MAAKRGKSQARRNNGSSSGLPGWAWMVLGIVLTIVVVLVAPKYLKSNGDGFFRPQPNPDAEPAPAVASEDEAVANDTSEAATPAKPKAATDAAAGKDTDYDFYTLLPGKEVPMSDAELAASERAEAQRQAPSPKPAAATPSAPVQTTPTTTLPKPVDTAAATTPAAATVAAAATAAPADDGTRYLLQAGAFQASGQAEEMKARIAMLGLGARVEAASIGGKTVYRVRMGPYGTASDLAEAKRKLASGGLPAMAIKVK
ncbi:SPOR domain-containing protein [Lysobacter cavernae]|uniref:SPOR domain-containing protein n=1 Tax=Lysobacter cavernae TaxID=1685901 RepID=A0ABV7RUV5_9GAMM